MHRSILFWLGLLVLIFLGWAWRQSVIDPSFVRVKRLVIINAAHRMHFDITTRNSLGEVGKATVAGDTWKQDYFPRPELMLQSLGDPTDVLKIPHWLIIAIVATLWIILLIARWLLRRKRLHPRERGASGPQNGP